MHRFLLRQVPQASLSIVLTSSHSDNIKAIIAEHKQRKGMTDAMVAKAAGINPGTFVQRKRNPGTFRLNDLWAICNVLDVPEEQRNTIL